MPNLLVTEDAHCRLELARVNASNDCGHCGKYFTASRLVLRRPLLDMRTEQGLNEPAHLAELSNSRAQCADSVYNPAARQWMPPNTTHSYRDSELWPPSRRPQALLEQNMYELYTTPEPQF